MNSNCSARKCRNWCSSEVLVKHLHCGDQEKSALIINTVSVNSAGAGGQLVCCGNCVADEILYHCFWYKIETEMVRGMFYQAAAVERISYNIIALVFTVKLLL